MATNKEEITFDEQAFMWDFIDIFKNVTIGADGEAHEVPYKNFLQIKDNRPSLTLNKINGQGSSGLEGLTNVQLSSLIPKMRLYKVLGDKTIEFPFNKFTNVESIITSALGRGTDVGIKSITMRDVGTNPANVGVSFEGDLELFFQSFEAIFKERNIGEDKISFADLLDQPRALGTQAGKSKTSQRPADNTPNLKNFKIKLEIGWSLPSDPEGVLGFSTDQRKEIEKLTRSYILQNANQVIDINQQDASVNLKISFYAGIEGLTLSPRADILYIDPSDERVQGDLKKREELKKQIKSLVGQKKETAKKKRDQEKATKEAAGSNTVDGPPSSESPKGAETSGGEEVSDFEKQIEEINKKIQQSIAESRSISYKRILNNLRNNFSNAPEQGDGKLRYFDISLETMDAYKEILTAASKSVKDRKGLLEKKAEQEAIANLEKEYSKKRKGELAAIKKEIIKNSTSGVIGSNDPEYLEQFLTSNVSVETGLFTKPVDASDVSDGRLRIYYFYLGDLIESVFDIIYNKPQTIKGTEKGRNTEVKNKKIYEELKMLLGPFNYFNPLENRSQNIQMADIPISLNYFLAWFYDNVVKLNRDNYVLRQFLGDLCSKLLNNVVSPKRVGVLAQSTSYKIRFQSLNVNKNAELNTYWLNTRNQLKERMDTDKLQLKAKVKDATPSKNISEWLYLYVVGDVEDYLAKESNDDAFNSSNNIPRFYIGGQTGLIKNVTFARTQIPFKFEAALTDQAKTTRRNLLFQDKYDANVELFGNPTLKPGMLIYLDPRGLGLGSINTTSKTGFQYQLGIGGYYRVVRVTNDIGDGIFTTSIQTVAELDLRDIQLIKQKGK
jgi:hypothetical protein